jgi:hypothetical protein
VGSTDDCPGLDRYDPALASLPVPALEERLRQSGAMMPSQIEQSLRSLRAAAATYREGYRDCMYRLMLLGETTAFAQIVEGTPSAWAAGRPSADLVQLFRTVMLRDAWTPAEREATLAFLEQNMIKRVNVQAEGDREYWRHLYYGRLIQCEASDETLRALGAPREESSCVRYHPRVP